MFDEKRLKKWRNIGLSIACFGVLSSLIIMIWPKQKPTIQNNMPSEMTSDTIQPALVKDFLKVYFTKIETGGNRKKYKSFMTQAAYEKEVAKEDEPAQKQYTDYMKNFKYDDAKVYIGSDDHTVFVMVKYDFEAWSLTEDNERTEKKTIHNSYSLKLHYVREDGKWLINRLDEVNLVPVSEIEGGNG